MTPESDICVCHGRSDCMGILPWPLVMTIHDCYEPPMAQIVVEAVAEYSDENCGLVMKFVAECAREHWSVN